MVDHFDIITTKDGSSSIFLPQLNETYHSTFGAITESIHVYVTNGLDHFVQKPFIRLLEVGFGTGLNALLAYNWSSEQKKKIHYTTLEPHPLPGHAIDALNYIEQLNLDKEQEKAFKHMHHASLSEQHKLNAFFKFQKSNKPLRTFCSDSTYDLIFYDCFAPSKQPELWNEAALRKVSSLLSKHGILTTYCSKGEVQRIFKSLGLKVKKLPGPKNGKREIINVYK